MFHRLADRRLVASHVTSNLGVPLTSITVDGLLDGGLELVGLFRGRLKNERFALGSNLFFTFTHLAPPSNVHDLRLLEPRQMSQFGNLLSGAKRSDYCRSTPVFNSDKKGNKHGVVF